MICRGFVKIEFQVYWRCWCLVEKLIVSRDSEDEIWSRFVFELVIWPQEAILVRWTQASGPLCLWQCLWNPQCPIKLADIKKSAKYPIRIVGQLDLWILLFQWSSSHLHHLLSLVRIGQPPLLICDNCDDRHHTTRYFQHHHSYPVRNLKKIQSISSTDLSWTVWNGGSWEEDTSLEVSEIL